MPISVSFQYSNSRDNQDTMTVSVYECMKDISKSTKVQDCTKVAKFEISGIDGITAGDALLLVEYGVGSNGEISIIANNRNTIKS